MSLVLCIHSPFNAWIEYQLLVPFCLSIFGTNIQIFGKEFILGKSFPKMEVSKNGAKIPQFA